MVVINLSERLHRLAKKNLPPRGKLTSLDSRAEDASFLRRLATMIEQKRLVLIAIGFESENEDVDTVTISLRSTE